MTRLGRVDLVGPVVAFHVVGLAVLDAVERPVPVMVVAGGLVVSRIRFLAQSWGVAGLRVGG